MSIILPKGTQAPAFTLRVTPDQSLSLDDFDGRRVVLAFYPADWSPVCGDQMSLYNHVLPEFRRPARNSSVFRLTGRGATRLSRETASCILRFFPTSNRRELSPNPTAPIGVRKGWPSVLCS